jgi:hypothetical protein
MSATICLMKINNLLNTEFAAVAKFLKDGQT